MADLENTVMTEGLPESAADDALLAPAEEATDESIALSEALGAAAEGDKPQDTDASGAAEQGAKPVNSGIKGRLLESERKGHDKGYAEGQAAAQAAWQAEKQQYESRLQRLEEIALKEDARELAKQEGCSEALAMRILRAERGLPAQQEAPAQPRDEKGRFTSNQQPKAPDVNERAQQLFDQAKNIQRMGGVDVMALFNENPEIRSKVSSGEMDFYDVAREYGKAEPRKQTPPVTRSGQPGVIAGRSIADLSDDEFDRLNRLLEGGAVIDMRR